MIALCKRSGSEAAIELLAGIAGDPSKGSRKPAGVCEFPLRLPIVIVAVLRRHVIVAFWRRCRPPQRIGRALDDIFKFSGITQPDWDSAAKRRHDNSFFTLPPSA
jgi:hypothetical protein